MKEKELVELLKTIYWNKVELCQDSLERSARITADAYYWESHGLEIAIKLMTNPEYYKSMKEIYLRE